jgi:putative effector of murein hydrolase LrgA (UPF0299 family)
MIHGFALLLACQVAGEALSRSLSLPVPGPVLGLVLLLCALRISARLGRPALEAGAGPVADGLLRHLALLFVPAGVGVVQHGGLIAEHGPALLVALAGSTVVTLAVTALVFAGVARAVGGREERP